VVWHKGRKEAWGGQEGMEHRSNTWLTYLWILLIPIGGGMPHHQAMSSTFEFLHNCCCKFFNVAYKGGSMSMLKSSSPLCCGFLHLFLMFVFGIVNSLLGGRKICPVVCHQVTSPKKHNLVWWSPTNLCILFNKKLWVKGYELSHVCWLQHALTQKVIIGVANGLVWDKVPT
jgi:hypothetical protein